MARLLSPFRNRAESEFDWTCGGDSRITHRRFIDNGGYGEVHEVSLSILR